MMPLIPIMTDETIMIGETEKWGNPPGLNLPWLLDVDSQA
jgi:hypothetical protein